MDYSTASGDILLLYKLLSSSPMIIDTDSGVRLDYAYPAFYLNSNVEYISGNGSLSNPYIIN